MQNSRRKRRFFMRATSSLGFEFLSFFVGDGLHHWNPLISQQHHALIPYSPMFCQFFCPFEVFLTLEKHKKHVFHSKPLYLFENCFPQLIRITPVPPPHAFHPRVSTRVPFWSRFPISKWDFFLRSTKNYNTRLIGRWQKGEIQKENCKPPLKLPGGSVIAL